MKKKYFSKTKFGNVDNLRTTFFGTPVFHAGIFLWEKFSLKIMVEKFALLRYYSITIFHNNSPSTITTPNSSSFELETCSYLPTALTYGELVSPCAFGEESMEVTVESQVREDFKSSCECLKTNLDQSQVESNEQITGPQRFIHVHVLHVYIINYELRLLNFHLLQLVTYCDL